MRLPYLNNSQLVRGYLTQFERRFVQTGDGVVYLPGETGAGVKLPVAEAASLIAGMRATMVEVDGRQPLSGQDAFFLAGVLVCVTIMIGALTGFHRTAAALLLPIVIAIALLGPVLGVIRTQLAWHRGLREAEQRMEQFQRLAPDQTRQMVRPNPLRPVMTITLTLSIAVIVGLIVATATTPTYAAVALDRFLGWAICFVVLAIVVLAFAHRTVEAVVRPPVSEAEIRLAVHDRQRRPLVTEEASTFAPARARPAATRYGKKRRR